MLGKCILTAAIALLIAASATAKPMSSDWGKADPVNEVNTDSLDGCPILSPDGRSLYMASDRFHPDYERLNIWVARRESTDEPFGAPEILPYPINTDSADFCPTPLRGGRLLFVSRRTIEGVTCGLGDIYITRLNPSHGWEEPQHLGCDPEGPNSSLDEQGPSYVETKGGAELFFSRSVPAGLGVPTVPGDLFVSEKTAGWAFGPATEIAELNKPGNDIQPNVRKDGREMVFSSDHSYPGARGSQDIYSATRASVDDPWSTPKNLGTTDNQINTPASETRPSLSWDARTLLFGRPVAGRSSEIFISTR